MGLIIRSSDIHAAGCYTTTAIAKDALVVEYSGPRMHKDIADEKYENSKLTYLFGVGDGTTVIDGHCMAMFINHSCDPNCEVVIARRRVYIHSLRAIPEGTELFYDYWYTTDESYTLEDLRRIYPCRCGSPKCRGTLARPPRRVRKPVDAR